MRRLLRMVIPAMAGAARRPQIVRRLAVRGRRIRLRKVGFIIGTNAVLMFVLLLVGEYAMRWAKEGGSIAGLASFVSRRTAESHHGTNGWVVYDADLGYKLNPAKTDSTGKRAVNSLGIRNPEVIREKPIGTFRVILMGDSVGYTDAPDLPDGSMASVLKKRLEGADPARTEMINACIPGYTTYQERRLLERDLLPLKPDLVILQYCLNDNHRFLHEFEPNGQLLMTRYARAALTVQGDGWWARLNRSSYLLFEIRRAILHLSERHNSRFPWDNDYGFASAWQDQSWPDFEANIASMAERLGKQRGRLAVVAVPYQPQLRQDLIDLDSDYTRKPQRRLSEICRRQLVPVLDLYAIFLENRDRMLYTDGVHLHRAGIELVTDELVRFLKSEGLAKDPGTGP